jgi:hypothetical protein
VPDIAGQLGVTKQAVYKSLDVIHALLLRCIRRAMAQEGR